MVIERYGSEYGTTKVCDNRGLIRVAFLNVIHNAIKFSPVAGKLLIGLAPDKAAGDEIQIIIQDGGPGLQKEDLERLFERFYRGATQLPNNQAGPGSGSRSQSLCCNVPGGDIRFDAGFISGARCILPLKAKTSA